MTVAPQPLVVTTKNIIRLRQVPPEGTSPWSAAHLGCPAPNPGVRGYPLPACYPHPQGRRLSISVGGPDKVCFQQLPGDADGAGQVTTPGEPLCLALGHGPGPCVSVSMWALR